MDKVNQQTDDVTSITILICHNHYVPVAERFDAVHVVFVLILEPNDINQVFDLLIIQDYFVTGVSNIK